MSARMASDSYSPCRGSARTHACRVATGGDACGLQASIRCREGGSKMKVFFKLAVVTCAAALTAAFLLAQSSEEDKAKDKAAKAKRIADIYKNNARVLTMYD